MSSKSELGGDPVEDCKRRAVPPTSPIVDEAAVARLEILTQDVFSNLLIRKEILKNLEIPDLLRASLVCKGWRIFCREALRVDHRVMAVIPGTCHDLKTFSSILETSPTSHFNGLFVDIHPTLTHHCLPTVEKEALEIASTIAVAMDLKRLSVRVDGLSEKFDRQCGSVGIIREILKERAESLEELRFFDPQIWSAEWRFLELLGINDESFFLPNLRRLEFPSNLCSLGLFFGIGSCSNSALNRLITVSPKLIEITGAVVGDNLELLLSRGAAQFVREFHFEKWGVAVETLHRFASLRPTLHALSFSTRGPEKEQAIEVMKMMLESSKKSLKMLRISEQDLVYILHRWEDGPVFENVKYLRLAFYPLTMFGRRSVLSKVECSKYFPNLEQVCVDYRMTKWKHGLGWFDMLRSLPGEYSCASVTKIIITREVDPLYLVKKVFPNAKVCWLRHFSGLRPIHVSQLWSAWSRLEEICIFGIITCSSSYDATFMGISEEECHFLLQNITDFQSLELVPAKRSILDFRKLKKLVLQFDHGIPSEPGVHKLFLSAKVCSWMLSRMPGLTLEVDPFCRRVGQRGVQCGLDANVGHLSQFAKFVRHDFRPYF